MNDFESLMEAKKFLVSKGYDFKEKINPFKVIDLLSEYHQGKVDIVLADVSKCNCGSDLYREETKNESDGMYYCECGNMH